MSLDFDASEASSLYSTRVRPWLGELLQALRLNITYTRAADNTLFYSDQGQERQVLDFLGGYGANFFGHYHPRLQARLIALIQAQVPLQAQGSIRLRPALLAEALSQRLQAWTGKNYVVTFTNSGAETVEAALKHAKLAYGERRTAFTESFGLRAAQLLQSQTELPATWLPPLLQQGYQGPPRLREAFAFIEAHNAAALAQAPMLLAMQRGFHGKTTAAVQLTANQDYRRPFQRLGFDTRFLRPELAPLEDLLAEARVEVFRFSPDGRQLQLGGWSRIVACFAEPLQGEGGIHTLPQAFLQACRQAADAEGFPLIFDEIQCGMGRTGSFVYSEQLGVAADYYLLAKSLGGGLTKLGALLVPEDQYCLRFGKLHSSTFAEDELSAGVALEALTLLDEEQLMPRAAETGAWLKSELEVLARRYDDVIADVRGTGLMLGIELHSRQHGDSPAIQMLSEQQLLGYAVTGYLLYEWGVRVAPTLSSPLTLRLEPAATIDRAACRRLLDGLDAVCRVLQQGNVYHLTRFLVGLEGRGDEIQTVVQTRRVEPVNPALPQVAFAGHFIQARDMALWDQGFALFPADKLEVYLEQIHRHLGPVPSERITVTSATGAQVQLHFIGICAGSRQMSRHLRQDPEPMARLIAEAQELAASEGCSVLGLGGYNSIVTANATVLPPHKLALTTGNALTVGMGLRAIHQAAIAQGIDLGESCFAALGANGNIASVYSELMADEVPRLILIGRPGRETALFKLAARIYRVALATIATAQEQNLTSELRGVARAIYHSQAFHRLSRKAELELPDSIEKLHLALQELGEQAPIRLATELSGLRSANLILGASNAPEALIYPDLLGGGPGVICDVSVPADTHISVLEHCPNFRLIQGGIVRLPKNPDFKIGGIPLEKSLSFACMGETLLMGLTGMRSHFSYGAITREQVQTMLKLADLHGFELGRARVESSY